MCLLLIPVPHQLPCGIQSSGDLDHCPPAPQALRGCTHTHSLGSLATRLISAVIKTSIPTAVLLLLLFTQQLGLMRWFLRVTHSTIALPGHSAWGSCYLGGEGRLTASFSHFMLATSSLPFEDAWSRCLMTVYCGHLQQKSQTAAADTASSSRNITDCSITDQRGPSSEPAPPARRMSQENDPMELRRLWCAAMALQGWGQQARSELSDYRLK